MANMFTGKSEKQIPKTLSECTSPDATASNLHYWSEKLENWGQILFVILIIIGIISTIVDTVNMADIDEDMAFATCITSAITWALYAFIEYCAYHVLALLISALASITQNTIISANVALYEASQNCASPVYTQTAIGIDSSNPTVQSPKPNAVQYVNHGPAPDGMWACKNCGTHNSLNYGQCKKCGKFKS